MRYSLVFSSLLVISLLAAAGVSTAQDKTLPKADELLAALDANLTFETRTATVTMTVIGQRRTRVYTMRTFGRGTSDSAMEYLAPARDKGTKMLKLGDDLWIYMPTVDRTQKISGHMLRQGMMGSDVSYEDLMASNELRKMYEAETTGEGVVDGRACWTVELNAKDDSVSYPRRVSWVDKETLIPLKQELYALSGMLLKTWTMSEVKEFEGGRRFPTRMEVTDHVKKDSSTVIAFDEMTFGVELETEVFSQRWLERK